MIALSEHRIQTVFAIVQSAVVVCGSLASVAVLNARGFPESSIGWHPLPVFVRSWGFVFLLVPVIWVIFSLWYESNGYSAHARRWNLWSGIILVFCLIGLFAVSVILGSGAGNLIQYVRADG